jgi:hypothetical protein
MSNPLLWQKSDSNFYSLPSGILQKDKVYFWMVIAQGSQDEGSSSPVRSFIAEERIALQKAIFPPDDYSITAEGLQGMRFNYQSDTVSQSYFQVSAQSDFSSLAVNDPVETGGFYTASELEPGIWYWRIYTDGKSSPASTVPRRLNIVAASEAPRLRSPASLSRGSALELAWDPLYFTSYQVNVYNTDDPGNSVEQQITENNSAALSTSSLEPGDYIVSVAGFNPESPRSVRITGVPAEARFTVMPTAAPEPVQPVVVMIPVVAVIPLPEPVEPEPPAPIAAVVPPPEPVEPEPAPEPIAAVAPPPEPVIQPRPAAAPPPQTQSEGSAAAKLAGISRSIPGSLPPNGYVLTTGQLADVSSINFTWEGNVPEYRFTLYRANGEVVVPPSFVNAPSFTVQNPRILEPGDYVWEIIERNRQGRLGESMAARFTVIEGPMIFRTLPTNNPGVLYGNR